MTRRVSLAAGFLCKYGVAMSETYDVAILGGGPVGLEAALRSVQDGHRTALVERGRIADNVRDWGHVRLFSPFGMNSSERGREAIGHVPDADALLTGRQFVQQYLAPLGEAAAAAGVEFRTATVTDVRRCEWPKGRGLGDPKRAEAPFQVRCEDDCLTARHVLDCTGTYASADRAGWEFCRPNEFPVVPPVSEASEVTWGPVDPASLRGLPPGTPVLVVGSGYTAATDVLTLHEAGARLTWLTRRKSDLPIAVVEDDPLPARAELTRRANELASSGAIDWRSGHVVTIVEFGPPAKDPPFMRRMVVGLGDGCDVTFEGDQSFSAVYLDTGFRPDTTLFRELHVNLCYATEGLMRLAAKLLGETDCLKAGGSDAELLKTPEPGFFILGSKSYGRNPHFLMRAGIEQVDSVFDLLIPKPVTA